MTAVALLTSEKLLSAFRLVFCRCMLLGILEERHGRLFWSRRTEVTGITCLLAVAPMPVFFQGNMYSVLTSFVPVTGLNLCLHGLSSSVPTVSQW